MPATRFIRRMTAALLVPLVVLIGLSTAQAFYRCAMDRVARTVCCCAKMHERSEARAAATATPQLEAACCCSIERTAATEVPAAQVHDRDSNAAAQSAVTLFVVELPALPDAPQVTRVPNPKQQLAPPRTTASLFSQRIAFLV
jgi:hypothetical protein